MQASSTIDLDEVSLALQSKRDYRVIRSERPGRRRSRKGPITPSRAAQRIYQALSADRQRIADQRMLDGTDSACLT